MSGRKDKPRDPFLLGYQPSELRIASEFLNTWLPFLSRDLCPNCSEILTSRIRSLDQELVGKAESAHTEEKSTLNNLGLHDNHDDNCDTNSFGSCQDVTENNSFGGSKDEENEGSENIQEEEAFGREITPESHSMKTPESRVSWADMVQEDELEGEEEESGESKRLVNLNASTGKLTISRVVQKPKLPREQREYIRFMNVNRNKDFMCFERINGKLVNILAGLELHTGIFSAAEQTRIVNQVYLCQEMGKKGELKERTYTAPRKWMRGKGRVTIQFGCCYNYATDKNGNPPGILQNECVDPIPHLFKVIIRRLVQWHVLPPTCIPDSCIVNIYDEGDCIPPHIDNHDFVRPFCTVSFLSECNIVFGTNLEVKGPGEFTGPIAIPLPMGSVLVLNGNGADLAKHCVPAVPQKRISITFRRMDESKRPTDFIPEPDLLNIQPLSYDVDKINRPLSHGSEPEMRRDRQWRGSNINARRFTEYATTQSEPRNSTWTWHGPVDRRRVRLNLDG